VIPGRRLIQGRARLPSVKLRRGRPSPVDASPGAREDRHGSVNGIIAKMREADGITLGSPVCFSDITPVLKALIDRSGRVGRAELKSYLLGIGAQIPRGFEPRFSELSAPSTSFLAVPGRLAESGARTRSACSVLPLWEHLV